MICAVRKASGADWAICRTLLPNACAISTAFSTGLLAFRGSPASVVGAAVLHFDDSDAELYLKVVRPARRSGVGSELLKAAIEVAAAEQACRLVATCDTGSVPGAEPFLVARGFSAAACCPSLEADVPSALPVLWRARDWLVSSGRIPPSLTVTFFRQEHEAAVAQLCSEHIAQRATLAHAPLRLDAQPEIWKHSPVLLVDGQVRGAVLVNVVDDVASVPAMMVATEFHGTWMNAVLLGALGDVLVETGAKRVHFSVPPHVTYTRKLARRCGARTLSTKTRFERPL